MAEERHYYAFLQRKPMDGRIEVQFLTHPDSEFKRHSAFINVNDAKDVFSAADSNWQKDEGLRKLPYFRQLLEHPDKVLRYDTGMYNLLRAKLGLEVIGGNYGKSDEDDDEEDEKADEDKIKSDIPSEDGDIDLAP